MTKKEILTALSDVFCSRCGFMPCEAAKKDIGDRCECVNDAAEDYYKALEKLGLGVKGDCPNFAIGCADSCDKWCTKTGPVTSPAKRRK